MFAELLLFLVFSRQYLNNIGLVDSGVAEMVSIIEEFFDYDERTAYVFTSDHGMTNWGEIISLIYASQMSVAQDVSSQELLYTLVSRFTWCRPSLRDSYSFGGVGSWSPNCSESN